MFAVRSEDEGVWLVWTGALIASLEERQERAREAQANDLEAAHLAALQAVS